MHVKFVTLRAILTLGGQIYVLDALSPSEISCMGLDIEGPTFYDIEQLVEF